MNLVDTTAQALLSLAANRRRAFLAMMGVVFGIAAVETAFAVGIGARRAALDEIGSLGLENIFVRSLEHRPTDRTGQGRTPPMLMVSDLEAIAETFRPTVPIAGLRSAPAEFSAEGRRAQGVLAGVTIDWNRIAHVAIAEGRWLSESDVRDHRRVAVVGSDVANELLGHNAGIGSRIFGGGAWYTVVGTLIGDRNDGNHETLQRVDARRAVFVTLEGMDVALAAGDSVGRLEEITIRCASAGDVDRAAVVLPQLLRRLHGDTQGFEIIVPRQLLEARFHAQRTFDVVMGSVAALALLISGVGIMNIMLATVGERIQEIGVRRAFGAKRNDIVNQFAVEAAALCLAGGMAGVPIGVIFSWVVAHAAGWPIGHSFLGIAAALSAAVSVGVGFGIYPARVAASTDPAEALRSP